MDQALHVGRDDTRYTLSAGDKVVSRIDFTVSGDTITFTHTTTALGHRGRGHAGALTRAALADVRDRGLRLVPACPFTAAYLRRHPDQGDLVAGAYGTAGYDAGRRVDTAVT